MSPVMIVLIIAGNAVVLIGALFGAGRWFRSWMIRTVSEPIEKLQINVDTVDRTAQRADQNALRAHERLDRHLEATHA